MDSGNRTQGFILERCHWPSPYYIFFLAASNLLHTCAHTYTLTWTHIHAHSHLTCTCPWLYSLPSLGRQNSWLSYGYCPSESTVLDHPLLLRLLYSAHSADFCSLLVMRTRRSFILEVVQGGASLPLNKVQSDSFWCLSFPIWSLLGISNCC